MVIYKSWIGGYQSGIKATYWQDNRECLVWVAGAAIH